MQTRAGTGRGAGRGEESTVPLFDTPKLRRPLRQQRPKRGNACCPSAGVHLCIPGRCRIGERGWERSPPLFDTLQPGKTLETAEAKTRERLLSVSRRPSSLVRTRAVAGRGGGLGEKPAPLSELPFRPALAATPLPFRVVHVDRLLQGQADLHAVEPELLLQVFGDVPSERPKQQDMAWQERVDA